MKIKKFNESNSDKKVFYQLDKPGNFDFHHMEFETVEHAMNYLKNNYDFDKLYFGPRQKKYNPNWVQIFKVTKENAIDEYNMWKKANKYKRFAIASFMINIALLVLFCTLN